MALGSGKRCATLAYTTVLNEYEGLRVVESAARCKAQPRGCRSIRRWPLLTGAVELGEFGVGCAAVTERANYLRAVERYGDQSIPSRSTGSNPEQRSGLLVEGARLELVLEQQQSQDVPSYRLFIDAAVPSAYELTLELGAGILWTLRNLFRRVRCGDDVFDRKAVVRANDVELARLWLSRRVREACLDSLRSITRIDRGLLHLEVPRNADYADVEAGLRTAARLVGRAEAIGETVRSLAAQLEAVASDGDWRPDEVLLACERNGLRIELEHVLGLPRESWRARGLRTRLRAGRAQPGSGRLTAHPAETRRARRPPPNGLPRVAERELSGWTICADDRGLADSLAAAQALLARVRPESIAIDESMVTVTLPGAPLDPDVLPNAFALTEHLAAGALLTDGPYR